MSSLVVCILIYLVTKSTAKYQIDEFTLNDILDAAYLWHDEDVWDYKNEHKHFEIQCMDFGYDELCLCQNKQKQTFHSCRHQSVFNAQSADDNILFPLDFGYDAYEQKKGDKSEVKSHRLQNDDENAKNGVKHDFIRLYVDYQVEKNQMNQHEALKKAEEEWKRTVAGLKVKESQYAEKKITGVQQLTTPERLAVFAYTAQDGWTKALREKWRTAGVDHPLQTKFPYLMRAFYDATHTMVIHDAMQMQMGLQGVHYPVKIDNNALHDKREHDNFNGKTFWGLWSTSGNPGKARDFASCPNGAGLIFTIDVPSQNLRPASFGMVNLMYISYNWGEGEYLMWNIPGQWVTITGGCGQQWEHDHDQQQILHQPQHVHQGGGGEGEGGVHQGGEGEGVVNHQHGAEGH